MMLTASSSGLKAADATIYTGPCRLLGVELIGDGTNACNVILYDNTSAAGTAVAKLALPASGITYCDAHIPVSGVSCDKGLYADVTGTGAGYIVHFAIG
jgi:type II secretory pathway component PulL